MGDAEDFVKGGGGIRLVRRDFVADAEDFTIYFRESGQRVSQRKVGRDDESNRIESNLN